MTLKLTSLTKISKDSKRIKSVLPFLSKIFPGWIFTLGINVWTCAFNVDSFVSFRRSRQFFRLLLSLFQFLLFLSRFWAFRFVVGKQVFQRTDFPRLEKWNDISLKCVRKVIRIRPLQSTLRYILHVGH